MNLARKQFIRKDTGAGDASFISFYEGDLVLKQLTTPFEEFQAYRLRHRIYCQELKWVPESGNALEIDEYDANAVSFGVFNTQNKLIGFFRLIVSRGRFMIEREFTSLVGNNHKIRKDNDTVEGSRLCVAPEARNSILNGNFGVYGVSMLLYKGAYLWCLENDIQYLYLVAEYKTFRLLRAIIRCNMIGEPQKMSDGVIAVAALMDLREFERINNVKRPEMQRWFTQYQSSPIPWPQPQPGTFSQHRDAA